MLRRLSPFICSLATAVACGGGADGLGTGGTAGTAGLQPHAISAAANPASAADVRDVLEPGDHYRFEPSNPAANAIFDSIWARLAGGQAWTATARVLTYQFFNDDNPQTHWGRAYRYTGTLDNYAGPIRAFTAGTYTRANGSSFQAVILQTWDNSYAEILVLVDPSTFVHANQNVNGLPITDTFSAR